MHNVNLQKREIQIGSRRISIETGKLAKQADGSVLVRSGDTVVLVTACHAANAREGIDFLPLTVDYREYTYASGRIPGGFFKREGKPSAKEVLTSRLIDRPSRPPARRSSRSKPRPWTTGFIGRSRNASTCRCPRRCGFATSSKTTPASSRCSRS